MEVDNKRVLEILLGTILIILLIIMTTLLLNPETPTGSSTTITNSFNTNNYYNTQKDSSTNYKRTADNLDYDYSAFKKIVKGILGNNIEHYIVYVKNQDYQGEYFRVTFYFKDYYGKTTSESITHYIPAKKAKEFTYKNIHKDKYKFHNWNYEIIPI